MTARLSEFRLRFLTLPGCVAMNIFPPQIIRKTETAGHNEAERLLQVAGKQGTSGPHAVQGFAVLNGMAVLPIICHGLPSPAVAAADRMAR